MSRLAPCPSCGRHVLVSESACPFCAHAFEAAPVAKGGDWARRVGRVGAIAAVAGALAATGCPGGAQALYGVPAPDAGDGDGDMTDAGDGDGDGDMDSGMIGDGDGDIDAGLFDAGGPMPEYGAPAPIDAGSGNADYGAPPEP